LKEDVGRRVLFGARRTDDPESPMFSRFKSLLLLIATGCVLLQAPTCDTTLQVISTGLLAALTGLTFFLARNV
jgi:hypothetical protein